MAFYPDYLFDLEDKICQPNLTSYPDSDLRKDIYIRNKGQLRANIIFLAVYGVINIIFQLQAYSHLFWMGFTSLHLITLVLFCRTNLWICFWIYTLSVTFGQLVFISLIQDSFVYALIASFLTPLCVLGVTKSATQVILNFFCQFALLHFKYKPMLTDLLIYGYPAEFSEKFITAASLALVAITIGYTVMFQALQENQKQLKLSKHEAEQACSQLTLFLQTFSHELRNPLNSLLGNLQLVLQEQLPPKLYESIETAKICGDLLLQMINNILDTGKAATGKLDISLAPVGVTEYISGIWRIAKDLMKRKKLKGGLKVNKQIPSVLNIDSYRINQVLLNLLSNAIKFTDQGQIWISFNWVHCNEVSDECFAPYPYDEDGLYEKNNNFRRIDRNTPESDSVIYLDSDLRAINCLDLRRNSISGILKIIIQDTGSGIKEENMKLLFEKFSQIDGNVTKRKIGTGLGLYITKQICQAMGGEIRVYSKENVGTTFIVCIPVSPADINENGTDMPQAISHLSYLGPKILLVDDNIFNLDLLKNYAGKIKGQIVGTAKNGLEGYFQYVELKRARKKIDIIFLDVDMPVMDGGTMCKKIREYEKTQNINPVKIVFVTGNYDGSLIQELREKNGEYRADDLVKKPLTFEIFIHHLEKLARQN